MAKQNQSIQSEEAVLVWTSCSKTGRCDVWDSTSFNFTTLGDPHNMNLWPKGLTKKRMLSNPLAIKEDSYWPKSSALSQSGTVSALPATQKENGRIEYRVTHVQSYFFFRKSVLLQVSMTAANSGLVLFLPEGRRKGVKAYFLSSGCNRESLCCYVIFLVILLQQKERQKKT